MEETKPRKTNNGPNFMKKLLGVLVIIRFHNRDERIGVVRGFNRYEILLEREGDRKCVIVMKHAIELITPLNEEPFKEEENETKTCT